MVAYQHIIDVASPLLVIQGNWSLPSSQDILPGLKDPVAVTQSIGSSIQVQQYGGNFTLLGGRAPPSNWSTESRAILTINSTSRDVSLLDSPDLIDDTTSNCSLSWNSAKVVITKYLPSSLQVTGVGMTLDIASEVHTQQDLFRSNYPFVTPSDGSVRAALSSRFKWSKGWYLADWSNVKGILKPFAATKGDETEVHFSVPANTSFLQMNGPAFTASVFEVRWQPRQIGSTAVLESTRPISGSRLGGGGITELYHAQLDPSILYTMTVKAERDPVSLSEITTTSYYSADRQALSPTIQYLTGEDKDKSWSPGALAGCIAGVVVGVILVVLLIICCLRKRRAKKRKLFDGDLALALDSQEAQISPFNVPPTPNSSSTSGYASLLRKLKAGPVQMQERGPPSSSAGYESLPRKFEDGLVPHPPSNSLSSAAPRRRIEIEEDMGTLDSVPDNPEEIVEVLPPNYRPEWTEQRLQRAERANGTGTLHF